MASRSRRSVTASAQALDHSLPGEPERSFPPLGLLFPTRTASLGSRGATKVGAPCAVGAGAHPRPRADEGIGPYARKRSGCPGGPFRRRRRLGLIFPPNPRRGP